MKSTVLDLGKEIYLVHTDSSSEVVHLGLMVGIGSRNDDRLLSGISHFVEHMWFKGTQKRNSTKIIEDIERFGGDFNAYTSKEETCVYVSILKDYSDVAFDVLSDIFLNSTFPEVEINKERDVICDEIDSYEDSPSELIFDHFEERFFGGFDLSLPVLGSKESLEAIDSGKMGGFYNETFLNAKLVISFVGNLACDEVLCKIKSLFCSERIESSVLKSNPDLLLGSRFDFSDKKKTTQSHCLLGCNAYSWGDPRRLTLSFLNNIIGGPQMSSLLSLLLRENNGLTYSVDSNFTSFLDAGLFTIYFGTDKKNVDKCLDLLKSEFYRICHSSLISDKLDDYKNQMLGQLALSYENNQNIMLSQAKSVMVYGKVDTFSELSIKVKSISSLQLLDVANDVLCFEKMSLLKYC